MRIYKNINNSEYEFVNENNMYNCITPRQGSNFYRNGLKKIYL